MCVAIALFVDVGIGAGAGEPHEATGAKFMYCGNDIHPFRRLWVATESQHEEDDLSKMIYSEDVEIRRVQIPRSCARRCIVFVAFRIQTSH